MIGAIVGEYFGGPIDALGVRILNDSSYGNFTQAWAGIVMASLLGIGFYAVIAGFERLATRSHPSARGFQNE
jgi:NitT/TauT family transport system permease protein